MTSQTRGEVVLGQSPDVFTGEMDDAMRRRYGPMLRTIAIPACRVYATAAQSIPSATVTPLTFDSEVFDTAGLHDPAAASRLTAPISGVYLVGAQVALPPVGVGVREFMGTINAADLGANRFTETMSEGITTEWRASQNAVVRLSAGDWVAFSVYQNSGAAINTNYYGTPLRAEAWMTWIGGVG